MVQRSTGIAFVLLTDKMAHGFISCKWFCIDFTLCLYGHDTVEATKKMMHPNIFDFCYRCVVRRKNFWCAHKAGSDGQGYKCS
jgi:hypothetical protein